MNGIRSRTTRATSSTRSISRVTSRVRQVGTCTCQSSETANCSRSRISRCSASGTFDTQDRVRPRRAQGDDERLRQWRRHVGGGDELAAAQPDDQLARVHGRGLGELRVDPLLPAIRRLGAQAEPLRRPQDRDRLEVRRLEQHLRRPLRYLRVQAAHDSRHRDRAVRVGDDEIARVEAPRLAVERPDLFAVLGAPDDDPTLRERRPVEHVQRAAERVHDVVRHVDDVRDRADPDRREPRPQPDGRGGHGHAPEDAPDVARAALEVLDPNVDLLGAGKLRILARHRPQLRREERRDLAGDAVDRQQVAAVHRRRDIEDLVPDREHVAKRSSRRHAFLEHHDPALVVAELELALGQDHPPRDLPTQLRLAERLVRPGQERAGQRDGDRGADAEVPGPADDLSRLPLADVDAAELQPVGVRVLAGLDHLADLEEPEVPVRVGDTGLEDAFDIE